MKNLSRHSFIFLILFALLIVGGCGTSRYQHAAASKGQKPVGVDSLTIAEADSLIPHLFVSFHAKQRAAKLCAEGEIAFVCADSLWRTRHDKTLEKVSRPADSTSENSKTQIKNRQKYMDDINEFLAVAEKKFQKSIEIDPFPLNSRDGLVRTYFLRAEVEQKKIYYKKAEQALQEIISREKGEHYLFFKLGECCFQLEKWDQAFKNYHQATDVFVETKVFSRDSALTSSANELHFTYLYSQAVCLSKMYRADEAIALIHEAKKVATTKEHKAIAERFENWLNWDNGNIQTAEMKNKILKLVKAEKYAEAADQFQNLKESLTDPFAIDEIDWRIAGLEFQYLNKKEQACERLLRIVRNQKNVPTNSTVEEENMQQYLKDCGAMHYHLGMSYIDKADYRLAKKYLDVGAEIDWYGNYKCQLKLAKMNKHNPQISLNLIEKVLDVKSNLSVVEQIDALQVKLKVLKKMGSQYLAEAKQTYLQIRELQKN